MRASHLFAIAGMICLLFLCTVMFRPLIISDEKDCLVVEATVSEIYEAGIKDVVFRLKGQNRLFYVNRGLEQGLDLDILRKELINKMVIIKYPEYWTFDNSSKHISKIQEGDRIIFSELD